MSYSWGSYQPHNVMSLPLSKKYASSSGPINNDERPILKPQVVGAILQNSYIEMFKS